MLQAAFLVRHNDIKYRLDPGLKLITTVEKV